YGVLLCLCLSVIFSSRHACKRNRSGNFASVNCPVCRGLSYRNNATCVQAVRDPLVKQLQASPSIQQELLLTPQQSHCSSSRLFVPRALTVQQGKSKRH